MRTSMTYGCLLLALAAGIAGCNSKAKEDEKLLKDQIATLDKLTEVFDKMTDKDTFGSAQPMIKIYMEKLGRQQKEFDTLPDDRKEAALKLEGENVELANARLTMAKDKMRNLVFGKGAGPGPGPGPGKDGPLKKGHKNPPPDEK